ncbi:MAG TPA: divalent-cation tolerance protein CutA, partial [Candidatus Thermoplasmatota archaeon]
MAKRAAVAWVQTNVSDAGEARALARAVVRARLAACANVWPIESEYWWEGKVVHAREVVVHLKTSPGALRPLVAAVRRAHPYDV